MIFDKLLNLREKAQDTQILNLFEKPDRAEKFSAKFDGMLFDYSKTAISEDVFEALLELAEEIRASVYSRFGVSLEMEPRIYPPL